MTRVIGWCALIVLMVPNLYCVVETIENWPFTRYPMFSAPPPFPVKSEYGLVAVTTDGERILLKNYAPNNHQFMASRHFQYLLKRPDGMHRVEQLGRRLGLEHNKRLGGEDQIENKIEKVEFCRFDYPVSVEGELDERRPGVTVMAEINLGLQQ